MQRSVETRFDVDGQTGAQAVNRSERRPCRSVEVFPRNRPRLATAARLDERAKPARMAFVFVTPRAGVAVARPHLDRVPPFDGCRSAAAEDLDALDRTRAIAAGLVRDVRDRAV